MMSKPQPFAPQMLCLEEPLLEFRHHQRLVYPRDGLFLTPRQTPEVRVGCR